ncbi:MAG: autoinducer binding domain-containing protein [Geminicoccaceae bacterium]
MISNHLQDFIEQSNGCVDPRELFEVLRQSVGLLGFDRFAYGSLSSRSKSKGSSREIAVQLNYPDDWVEHYFEKDYQSKDPIVCRSPLIKRPFSWNELSNKISLERVEQTVIDEATDAGLKDGVTIPLHGPLGELAVVSLASSVGACHAESHLPMLGAIASQFHLAYDRLHEGDLIRPHEITLTPRERECLAWMARGKSSWDVGLILNISENTVNFHMKNIMAKFNMNNRVLIILEAVRQGLIKI